MGEMEFDAHECMEREMECGGWSEWGNERPDSDPTPGTVGYNTNNELDTEFLSVRPYASANWPKGRAARLRYARTNLTGVRSGSRRYA